MFERCLTLKGKTGAICSDRDPLLQHSDFSRPGLNAVVRAKELVRMLRCNIIMSSLYFQAIPEKCSLRDGHAYNSFTKKEVFGGSVELDGGLFALEATANEDTC